MIARLALVVIIAVELGMIVIAGEVAIRILHHP
jgi:hypothetical protein